MSAFQKRDNRNAVKAVKSFCKVCHDAGKSEAEYTSHFVKSMPGPSGVVVCPTLLAQQCGYCHTAGHTVSYCKLLKQHQKAKEHYERKCDFQESTNKTAVQAPKKNRTSVFAALSEDSDDEPDAKVVQPVCQFPALCEIKHVQQKTNAISYANMVSKSVATNAFAEAFQVAQVQPKKTKTKTIVTHNVSRRWVDMMSDSDDDGEEDEMDVSEISNDAW